MSIVRKTEKMRDEVLASVGVLCVDDNGDPHVNNGRGKKIGHIFPASGGIEPGRNSCRVVSLGHWASSLLSLQIRHFLGWSNHLDHAPLCARRGAIVCRCEHAKQTRGIWRGLYVERRTVGTHQVYGRTQASASSKKYFLLMLY